MYKQDVSRYINDIINKPNLNSYVVIFDESYSLKPLCIKIAEIEEESIRNDITFIKNFINEKYGKIPYKLVPLSILETYEFR